MSTTSRRSTARGHAAVMIVLAAGLAACGGGDDGPAPADTDAGAAPPVTADVAVGDGDDLAGAGAGVGEAIVGSEAMDVIDDLGIEVKADALVFATGADGYRVDGDGTLVLEFSEGSQETDGLINCVAGNGVLAEDEQLRVEYPDGTRDC